MRFRGKIIGTGKTTDDGPLILIRPYSIRGIPTTPEALVRLVEASGLTGEKVRITIEEE